MPERLSESAWAPFGWLPVADTDPKDGEHRMTFVWDDAHVNIIGHFRNEVPETETGLRCEMLFRHDTHTQTLMPMSGDSIVVVAPGGVDFSEPAHFDTVRAFVLARHTCVHLHRGTWHWGPYPLDAPSVRIFNVQGRGYAEDNGIAWLARDHGVIYEVPAQVRGTERSM